MGKEKAVKFVAPPPGGGEPCTQRVTKILASAQCSEEAVKPELCREAPAPSEVVSLRHWAGGQLALRVAPSVRQGW